jgi:hypothetical protein
MNNLLIIGLWVDNLVYYYLFGQESNAANLQTLSILAAHGWPNIDCWILKHNQRFLNIIENFDESLSLGWHIALGTVSTQSKSNMYDDLQCSWD